MNQSTSHRYPLQRAAIAAALLALALPVAGEAGEPLAIVPDARGHVAVARQHTARFDGVALELAAQSGKTSAAAPTARFQLLTMQRGETVFEARDASGPQVRVSGSRISYMRGAGIVERYDVLEAGVEQSFVLRRRWPGGGDLAITGSLDADQELGEPLPDGSGGLIVPLADGSWRLRYGAVTAIDAAGARRAGAVAIADGQVTITVDGAWLAAAAYPVVVDPLLTLVTIDDHSTYQGRPAAAFDFGGSAARPGATPARYLVAYETQQSTGVSWIGGRLVPWSGWSGTPASPPIDISANGALAHTRPTVAFKFGQIDSPKRNYLVAWQRSDGALGYRILDRSGSPLMPPATIAGCKLQDVTAAAGPQGGWGASSCGLTIGCKPYLLVFRAWCPGATAGPSSSVRLARVDDGNGALASHWTVESYAPVDDPIYAPHIAYGHSAKADYFVMAYRRPSGEIIARKVGSGGELGTAVSVTSSSNGPPVVAYSYADNRWAVFWRTTVAPRPGTGTAAAAIQGKIYSGGSTLGDPFMSVASVTAVSVLLDDFTTTPALLPDYSAAGTQTAAGSSPFQGLFELSYVLSGEVYSVKIYTGGTLGSRTRLTTNAKQDRYVKLAVTRIDPLTTSLADPLSCTGKPSSRCALWVFEHFFSSTDHDITGYWTSSQY